MRILKIIFIFIFCLYLSFLKADIIITTDNHEYNGDIIKEAKDYIIIKQNDNTQLLIPCFKIYKINDELYPCSLTKENYPVIGLTIGTPSALNFIIGYYYKYTGIRLSGGYLGQIYGYQGNLLLKISESTSFVHHLSVLAGTSFIQGDTDSNGNKQADYKWKYIGIGYDLTWYGIFLELDITGGVGDQNPQAGSQIGYLYRFNDK